MIEKVLHQLRNTRDLRAEMLNLAVDLQGNDERGRVLLLAPKISPETARAEWGRVLPAIDRIVSERMSLEIDTRSDDLALRERRRSAESGSLALRRPNYRHEILRFLIDANLRGQHPPTIRELIELIGVSQTPVRRALSELKLAGLVVSGRDGLEVVPEQMSQESLARVRALPETLKFRFERGAQVRPPADLLRRLTPLVSPRCPPGWSAMTLSGLAAAQQTMPDTGTVGLPRLDLLANLRKRETAFDTSLIRSLDDGLEFEPSVLSPAPVVVTIVRAEVGSMQLVGTAAARYASPCDVFLSLLDMGERDLAIQYAKRVRP